MKRLAPWLAAALGAALVLWVFWPGYMSWDSAYQWWQARHDQFDSVHPPLMAMTWQLTDRLVQGPGGMLALQVALLWSALALFASALRLPAWGRALVVLFLGLWPPLLAMQPHIWKDLWTLAGFAWALALLARDLRSPHRGWRAGAMLALVFACAFRHNAITGALPLLAWIAWREVAFYAPAWPAKRRALPAAVITLALAVGVFVLAAIPAQDARVRHTERVWSVVTLWDAAAVSLAEGKLVYPPALVDPSLDLEELRANFAEYANTTIYVTGKLRHSFDGPYTPAQREAIDALAWSLPRDHTAAYLAHRWRLSVLLFGADRDALPDTLVMMPGLHGYGDNPPVAPHPHPQHGRALATLQGLIDSPFFAGWIYLLVCALVAAVGIARAARSAGAGLAAVIALSSLAYALPLALASGSAEFRYLAWPVLATLASALLLAAPPVGGPSGPKPFAEKLRA
ncbi:hypothetical protein [Arenimonas sp.]|uniref:hypothetical protein n=1 Tax=Arenimonas sp. TaxID=1872635 RepID=UPI002E350D47|nr:hypothetical protein [Arenimonas sp.]HEX4854006.1 hypothetical protein [Arenimonas sp.]